MAKNLAPNGVFPGPYYVTASLELKTLRNFD